MRPNNLRRWLLRGALIASAATASLAGAEAAQADEVIWQNLPKAAAVADTDGSSSEIVYVTESEVIWQ